MRKLHVIGVAAGVAALVAWQPAFAQEAYDPDPGINEPEVEEYEPMDVEVDVDTEEEAEFEAEAYEPGFLATDMGIGIRVGGGIMNFAEEQIRDLTDTGGAWGAHVTIGTRSPIAFEASYIGSAMSFDALGVDPDAILLSNGATGALRFNLLQQDFQPYLLAGAGWRRFVVTNTDVNTSALRNDDNIFEVPLGVGVAYRIGGFMADLRGDYRLAFDDELLRRPVDDPDEIGNGLDNWQVTLSVGVEF